MNIKGDLKGSGRRKEIKGSKIDVATMCKICSSALSVLQNAFRISEYYQLTIS